MRNLSLIVLLLSISSEAATLYIKSGFVGSDNTGSSWLNPITNWTGASGSWVRGNTYYFAGGDYRQPAYARLDCAVSGTTVTTIKYSTAADHGTDTGWNNSFTNVPAQFRNWSIDTGYWLIDGQVGQGCTNMIWPPYASYGFVFHGTNMLDSGYMIRSGAAGNPVTNITFRHIENYDDNIPRTSNPPWYQSYEAFNQEGGGRDITYQYVWCHNMSSVGIDVTAVNALIDHCIVEQNGEGQIAMNWSPSDHSELMTIHPGAQVTIRNSIFRDWRSTGGLVFWVTTGTNYIYGNVFAQTGYWAPSESGDGDGILDFLNSETGPWTNYYCLNNTFSLFKYGASAFTQEPATNLFIENNLVYWSTNSVTGVWTFGPRVGSSNATTDYNWYYLSGPQSDAHIQNGSGDPFVDSVHGDYHLRANTTSGDSSFSTIFSTDPDGVTRSTWTRGAYEFSDPVIVTQPSNQTVGAGQAASWTVVATGNSTLHYQWKFNGSNVGTDNNVYTRNNCQSGDNGGVVYCVVSDTAGSANSASAILTVISAFSSQMGTAVFGTAKF